MIKINWLQNNQVIKFLAIDRPPYINMCVRVCAWVILNKICQYIIAYVRDIRIQCNRRDLHRWWNRETSRSSRDNRSDFLNLKQTDAISPQTRNRRRRISPGERSAESKSDTIGIHIRSLSLIRIDTYRASGAENMIASSPLSRWVSIRGERARAD